MLESLREKWGYKALYRAKRKERTGRELIPLDAARHVQLLVAGDDIERFQRTVELGQQLATPRRRVQVISVCLDKRPDNRLIMREGVVLFTRHNVSWLYKPTEPQLYDVTAPRPDILIDFSQRPVLPLLWLAHLSRANIKIGFATLDAFPLYDITFAMAMHTGVFDQFNVLEQYLSQLSGTAAS